MLVFKNNNFEKNNKYISFRNFSNFYKNYKNSLLHSKNKYVNFISTHTLKHNSILKKKVTSNASHSTHYLYNNLPFIIKHKKLMYYNNSKQGRSKYGILCRTKGSLLRKFLYPRLNKSFRLLSLSFVAGFFFLPGKLKSFSLVASSSGQYSYISSTYTHALFKTSKLYSIFENTLFYKKYSYLSNFIKLPQLFFTIIQLPKYKTISLLEKYPLKGVQYVRSPGSKAFLTKLDNKTSLALIKLPSNVYKVFSIYSVGSLGLVPFHNKNLKTQANAGFFKSLGKKSLSRGVARNPVDHPHGGRNKAIKYQRTP